MKLSVVLSLCLAVPAPAENLVTQLESDLSATHWRACLEHARQGGPGNPARASYVAGLCALKLHEPKTAKPLLEAARGGGFKPSASWRKPPAELLEKLDELEKITPALEAPGLDPRSLAVVFDAKTPWTSQVAQAAPEFENVGRKIFGAAPPFTKVYLFSDYARYERFFELAIGPGSPHGTGGAGLALMSEKRAAGRRDRQPVAVVLHELMHAWCQGYARDRYDRRLDIPPWVAEGMAVYVADSWSLDEGGGQAMFEKQVARRRTAPPFAQMRDPKAFRQPDENFLDYGLAARLVQRLVGPPETGLPLLRQALDGYAQGLDDEAAWRFTGKSPAKEFAALTAELWRVSR